MEASRADITALLRTVRRRWAAARLMTAAARTAGAATLVLATLLGIDRLLGPNDGFLAAVGVLAAGLIVGFAIRFFLPFRTLPDDRQVARFIEEHCPELEDRLASAVAVRPSASPLGRLVLDDAARRARRVDPGRIVDRGTLRRALAAGIGATAAFVALSVAGADFLGRIAQAGWLYAASPGGVAAPDGRDAPGGAAAPQVERIDVAYAYPAHTRLASRVDRGGGDVFAPEGTTVTITVYTDAPVRTGSLRFGSGGTLTLAPAAAASLAATFDVVGDDAYRVALGNAGSQGTEYLVRAIPDRPPVIELRRPAGDREITSVEEPVVEAHAEDDYALQELELVYTVAGRDPRRVNLLGEPAARVAGAHTLYAERLGVSPGDVISYYVRARDGNPRRTRDVRSGIYFMTVRPFAREYQVSMARSGAGMDADTIRRLAEMQKEIVAATWQIDRGTETAPAVRDDLTALADAQDELRERTLGAAAQMLQRGRSQAERDALAAAVAAMEQAEAQLRIGSASRALPPQLEALNQLHRVEAAIRRMELSFGQAQGSSAWWQPQEDLSSLFDRDLRREQQTNYEALESSSADGAADEESDALRRVRELAARQEALNRAQADLVRREDAMSAEEAARILARLTREQQQLREQAEALQRDLQQRLDGAGSGDGTADGVSETAQARRALNQLQTEVRAAELTAELQAVEALRRRLEASGESAGGEEDGGASGDDAGGEEQGEGGASAIGVAAQALLRQLEASPGLEAALRGMRPEAVESLERWAEHRFTGSSPGTEAFKQDYADWEMLRAGLREALEAIAADRAGALQRARREGRLDAGADDAAPDGYEAAVRRYFRALAEPRAPAGAR
ncbi:MAG: DUF4175 family protein [Acidobacteria bacterium]|nr:DUF4175 family protein [Acidobacteriota bacterium]MYJ03286.1 DUF4175 family protein [Acidobacteriota bacterium]